MGRTLDAIGKRNAVLGVLTVIIMVVLALTGYVLVLPYVPMW